MAPPPAVTLRGDLVRRLARALELRREAALAADAVAARAGLLEQRLPVGGVAVAAARGDGLLAGGGLGRRAARPRSWRSPRSVGAATSPPPPIETTYATTLSRSAPATRPAGMTPLPEAITFATVAASRAGPARVGPTPPPVPCGPWQPAQFCSKTRGAGGRVALGDHDVARARRERRGQREDEHDPGDDREAARSATRIGLARALVAVAGVGRRWRRIPLLHAADRRCILAAVPALDVASQYADLMTTVFSAPIAAKAWFATAAIVLALVQISTAARMWGHLRGIVPLGDATVGVVHRWSGRIAVLCTLPVVFHCVFILGFETTDLRVAIHSVVGSIVYGVLMREADRRAQPRVSRLGPAGRGWDAVRLRWRCCG